MASNVADEGGGDQERGAEAGEHDNVANSGKHLAERLRQIDDDD